MLLEGQDEQITVEGGSNRDTNVPGAHVGVPGSMYCWGRVHVPLFGQRTQCVAAVVTVCGGLVVVVVYGAMRLTVCKILCWTWFARGAGGQ